MSTYAIKQRLIAAGDDFDVRDSSGNKVFFIDGKAFSFGVDMVVKNIARQVLGRIKQKLFTFRPTFNIYKGGQVIGSVYKKLFTLRTRFIIDIPGPNDYEVVGNIFRYDYSFYRNKKKVAVVSKKILAFSDSYAVKIDDGEDEFLLICSAIIIDMLLHKGK